MVRYFPYACAESDVVSGLSDRASCMWYPLVSSPAYNSLDLISDTIIETAKQHLSMRRFRPGNYCAFAGLSLLHEGSLLEQIRCSHPGPLSPSIQISQDLHKSPFDDGRNPSDGTGASSPTSLNREIRRQHPSRPIRPFRGVGQK
jgi:hypothetical protein